MTVRPPPYHRFIVFIVAVVLLLVLLLFNNTNTVVVYAKVTSGSFQLSGKQSDYLLSSFAIVPTGGHVTIQLWSKDLYPDEESLRIHAYIDTDWSSSKFKKASILCTTKIQYSKYTTTTDFNYNRSNPITTQQWKSISTLVINNTAVDTNNNERNHYWYIVIDDCTLEIMYLDNKIPTIYYKIIMKNTMKPNKYISTIHDTHFSADQLNLEYVHLLVVIVSLTICCSMIGCIVFTIFKFPYIKTNTKSNTPSFHIAVVWVAIISALDAIGMIFEQIHLDMYAYNGIGWYTADAISCYFESLCDSFLILFFLSISTGWTLPDSILQHNNHQQQHRHQKSTSTIIVMSSFQKPITGIVCISKQHIGTTIYAYSIILTHLVLAQWSRIYNDEQESYHNYHHIPGQIVMIVRIIFSIVFWINCISIINKLQSTIKLQQFYKLLCLVGVVWFLSLPILTYICNTFIPYYQQLLFMTIGTSIIQSTSIITLAWFVTASSSSSLLNTTTTFHNYSHLVSDNTTADTNLSDSIMNHSSMFKGGNDNNDHSTSTTAKSWTIGKTKVRLD